MEFETPQVILDLGKGGPLGNGRLQERRKAWTGVAGKPRSGIIAWHIRSSVAQNHSLW